MKGIDIAWARPDVDGIKKTGALWVARYFSPDPSKNLTAAEVKAYVQAGLAIVTVWESTANRAAQGFNAGVADAKAAMIQRKAVGLPDDHVIYFAVDFDARWSDVKAYFDGVTSVLMRTLVGVYGGYNIIKSAKGYGIEFLWQTLAWSNGLWSQYADIKQTGGTVLQGGADIDYSVTPDFGQYPAPAPVNPDPVPTADFEEVEMILVEVDKTTLPAGVTWPGVFLLFSNGTLGHVTPPVKGVDNVSAYKASGLKAPVSITYAEYQARGGK